jgi:hypothetical protein
MKMGKFKITWATGVVEEVNQSDRETIEGYIDCRFGVNFDPEKAKVEFAWTADAPAAKPKATVKATPVVEPAPAV